MRKYFFFLVIFPLVLVLDQWTKGLILKHFYLGEVYPLLKNFFALTYVQNTGAAFGMLAEWNPAWREPFFFTIPVIALLVVGYYFYKAPTRAILVPVSLSFIAGGAIGNLIDRIHYGHVIDFLLFHWHYRYQFPAFNVADSAITVGIFLLIMDLLIQDIYKAKIKKEAPGGMSKCDQRGV